MHAEDCPEVSQPLSPNLSKNRKTKKLGKMGPYVTNQNASLSSGTQKAPGVSISKHQKLSSSDRLSSGPYPGLGSLGSGCNPPNGPVAEPSKTKNNEAIVPEVQQMSLPLWCSLLTSQVPRSRSGFSAYLAKAIQLSRGRPTRGTSAPTFFPIPIPVVGCFDRMPANMSNARRHALHMSRTVSVICMALNFWHCGGRSPPDVSLLRGPNKQHRCLFERIRSLIKSDGLASGFSVSGAGRRFPELCARLAEISSVLTMQGVSSDPYDKKFQGVEVAKDNSKAPELSPYRDLDPSRIVLHGSGSWDPCPFLGEELQMAFREPASLLVDIPPGPFPKIRDLPETVGSLARIWDERGLLFLHRETVMVEEQVRIFNAYKSAACDRQIGDKRGRNSVESQVAGPSSSLPGWCRPSGHLHKPPHAGHFCEYNR